MKARPRKIENRVAEELTKWSANRGDHYKLVRLPAMGRTGPDIDKNKYHFVIDVKSRIEVPKTIHKIVNVDRDIKWWITPKKNGVKTSWFYACRLDHFDVMWDFDWEDAKWNSIMVHGWVEKMRKWTRENPWDGVSGIGMAILHRPRKPVGSSVVVMKQSDWLHAMEILNLI